MDQSLGTVASAVIVPRDTPERTSKRRTSSITVDGPKRLRIDRTSGGTADSTENTNERQNMDEASPTRKRKALGGDEVREQERKRGQRLFGALLGTIGKFQQDSQSARARAGANRRKEIEEKLQQKLRQQNEELDEKKRRESTVLREKMQQEQRKFEERSLELKHANLRRRANYLCTKSRPPLYYLPWKLTEEEEARIQAQLDEAEATIERERAEVDRRRTLENEDRGFQTVECTNTDHSRRSRPSPDGRRESRDDDQDVMGDDATASADHVSVNPSIEEHENTNVTVPDHDNERRRSDATVQDGGDVVIEAGEDAVIY
ncbi:pinin/SDK/memA/ protein conserved region-domain-containing protein [Tirmania nivea]|nr:pinin/SDK/memA/ protein conserved region-domain-containing protein [Tirmania nivea]